MSNVIQFPSDRAKQSNKNRREEGLFINDVNGKLQGHGAPELKHQTTDHLTGKNIHSPNFQRSESDSFGDRIQRIKSSLEKINSLMLELKKTQRREYED